MPLPTYRAVIVGLTGIGAARPIPDPSLPVYHPTPPSHAAAYHLHPRTELVGICDEQPERMRVGQPVTVTLASPVAAQGAAR